LAAPAQASVSNDHPVPLPANADTAQCIECHTETGKGKVVHAAVTAGCTSCHQVNTANEKTTISLLAKGSDLCAMCHEVKKEAPATHGPYATGQCTICHNPHASEFPKLTRASGNSLCAGCHQERPAKAGKIQIFAGIEQTEDEFKTYPKVFVDEKSQTGHPFIGHPVSGGKDPFRKGEDYGCQSCHTPHTGEIAKLLPAEWKELDVCERCHTEMRSARKKP
jgi:predicted CXXCH cytochrome family protein